MLTLSYLRSKLRTAQAPDENRHLNADAAAAFNERTLSPVERKRALRHLSGCPDCRTVLLLLSSTAEPVPATVLPAKVVWGSLAAACAILCLGAVVLKSPSAVPSLPDKVKPILVTAASGSKEQYVPELLVSNVVSRKREWRIDRSRPIHVLQVSVDGSRTWRTIPVPRFEPSAVASDGDRVWVADSHRSVMESLDNGAHWAPLKPETNNKNDAVRSK